VKVAVLFDGAGLARLGLEQAGLDCTGFELDPMTAALGRQVGSGNVHVADARDVDLAEFGAVWASPPCQPYSDQNHLDRNEVILASDADGLADPELLTWALQIQTPILWVENVMSRTGRHSLAVRRQCWNAAQFLEYPIQRRRRMILGRYPPPKVWREFKEDYPHMSGYVPPAPLASEVAHGGRSGDPSQERRKFSRWYMQKADRMPTLDDMAIAQGFNIPPVWYSIGTKAQLSQAIGNGVPVYMAKAFGLALKDPGPEQLKLL